MFIQALFSVYSHIFWTRTELECRPGDPGTGTRGNIQLDLHRHRVTRVALGFFDHSALSLAG